MRVAMGLCMCSTTPGAREARDQPACTISTRAAASAARPRRCFNSGTLHCQLEPFGDLGNCSYW
jgi:hypothetical protein